MKPNRISQGAIPKTSTQKKPEDETAKPSIATARGTLKYREAARQVRAIEKENKARSAICHQGYIDKLKSKSQEVKPVFINIIGPHRPIKRVNKCDEDSITTISSEQIRSTVSKRPWIEVPCDNTVAYNRATIKTGRLRPEEVLSSESDYQGWTAAAPSCNKSENTTSCAEPAVPKIFIEFNADEAKMQQDKPKSESHMRSQLQGPEFMEPQFKRPCKASVVAGVPPRYTGTCPPNIEQIAKMSKTRQKFFLTQDPRRTHCLINPDFLRTKEISKEKELKSFSKLVKISENVCTGEKIEQHDPIPCETIDLENPLNLDFQGLDYKNTYEGDEQNIQNTRLYRRLCRHMDRKRAKIETRDKVEEDLQNERIAIPKRYDIRDRNPIIEEQPQEIFQLGRLYRSGDKPKNKKRIENELKDRRDHYKDLYLRKKARIETEKKKAKKAEEAKKEIVGAIAATQHFENTVKRIDDAIVLAVKGEHVQERKQIKRNKYPHTIQETNIFKQKLKRENRVRRDRALIKQEFYRQHKGTEKDYPELHLDVGDMELPCKQKIREPSVSESSDDDDNMNVGKEDDQFMLRGFHFKLGPNIRGKTNQREKNLASRKEKGCVTRDQWLNELAPKKRIVKLDVKIGIAKHIDPDDPNNELFMPERGLLKPKVKVSAIKEFIMRRLGRHYERDMRSQLKIKMPRLPYNVKKFNLIRFLYSENDKRLEALRKQEVDKDLTTEPLVSTLEYIVEKEAQRKAQMKIDKIERMKLLGIPCVEPKAISHKISCEPSDSETDSDWVPEREPDIDGTLAEYENRMMAGKTEKVSLAMMGNMPAPKFRECTLRRHPRQPRDYSKLRVPSQEFHNAVHTSGIPYMHKLEPDQRIYENVKLPKRPYTQLFEMRHHHDHWNPIQTNIIDVQYQPKLVLPQITKEQLTTVEETNLKSTFEKAHPPCKDNVNKDITKIEYDFKAILKKHRDERKKLIATDPDKEQIIDRCTARKFAYHSRDSKELENIDYPGRKEYLDFMNEIRTTLEEKKKAIEEDEKRLCINRMAYIEELEADLKSIETCLTSASSSVCSNLTNDSGSFLLMEGITKVPLDYIRKSVVPFEELQRSRFKAVPIDCEAEKANPFRMMPFSGQKNAQTIIKSAKDNFFTFTTRLRNGLRLRLETPIIDVRRTLIGRGGNMYYGAVTTDIDENYVTELKNRPPVQLFKFKSGRELIKNAQRFKFESMVIQGQLVRNKIYDRRNEYHWQTMQKTKILYEKLFAKWEKREYHSAMSIVYRVKSLCEGTEILRKEFSHLDHQLTVICTNIVAMEDIWRRRVKFQNFLYLVGDPDWRYENDWIHRVPAKKYKYSIGGKHERKWDMEGYAESIANRSKVNIRIGESNDVWAIKAFYEDVYLPNKRPLLTVFKETQGFFDSIQYFKEKTFTLLLELHITMAVHSELQLRLRKFEKLCRKVVQEQENRVLRKCSKKYFMEDRAEELKRHAIDYLAGPFDKSYYNKQWNKDRAIIIEVWRQIVPENLRGFGSQDLEPCDMLAMISDVVIDLIASFDNIADHRSRVIEARVRRRREYRRKISLNAYRTEKRIDLENKKVYRNLEPPFVKPKPEGKLKRVYLKKAIEREVKPDLHISEHTKFFFRAFHEEGDVVNILDARDSLADLEKMQEQIVPFYFDHFLKLNGHNVNYNFRTQTDMRDGAELDRLQVKTLIPEVLDRLDKWENQRKRIMEENIERYPKIYQNVKF